MDVKAHLSGLQRSWRTFHALMAVGGVGVLDELAGGGGPRNAAELAASGALDSRVLCAALDVLVGAGLLQGRDGRYGLAPEMESALADIREMVREFNSLQVLPTAVRDGRPYQATVGGVDPGNDQAAAAFLGGLHRRAGPFLEGSVGVVGAALGQVRSSQSGPRILDLGGGHGRFAAAFAAAWPTAEVVLFDQPAVVPHAARLSGTGFHVQPGDFYADPLGGPYDVVFISNVIHGDSQELALRLLLNVRRSLRPSGRVVVRDRLLHDDRSGPVAALNFGLRLVCLSARGFVRTRGEFENLLVVAGLHAVSVGVDNDGYTFVTGAIND